jgi:hypothetical protein
MVTGFSCHPDADEALRRGQDGFRFFGFALAHFYLFGNHRPGRTNIWKNFEAVRDTLPNDGANRGIGTPEQLRTHLQGFEEAGVDQVIFIQQGGKNRHQHICESLELFAAEVMPGFKEKEAARQHEKDARLAPAVAAALGRKRFMPELAESEIPEFKAYNRAITDPGAASGPSGSGLQVPREDPGAR